VVCSNCGTENRPGAKFCMECATPFAAPCSSCGATNPPGAKFCMECATPLGAARPAAPVPSPMATPAGAPVASGPSAFAATGSERRLVTILFADIVGFTPFSEERDSEEVREMLTRYFDVASEVITRYGGVVEKFIGDAVMAVWGAPTAREDDAERAVRAALDLVEAVKGVAAGIDARAGVLTGEAAVTLGAVNQGMVAGDIVNTAARLQSVAQPGTVLVGESTQRSASSAIVFEAVGEQALKGKVAPVPAFRALRVVAERGGRGRSDTLEAPFVGRDDELRLVKELFHATVREGRTRLVSITGIGGIGKSRLAWEFEKYLDGIVGSVWWNRGRSPAYGEGLTYWAIGEMIRGRAGLSEADDEATTRTKVAAMLGRHVPDEAERRWIEPAILALLGAQTGVATEQLFGAVRTFIERLSATGSVVLVFEDLHWADSGTLDFVEHLLEWSRTIPLLIVTLARPELLERRPDWGAGKRSFTSIYLEPLAEPAMRQLLAGLVPGLPEASARAIVARADGIPLYAVETVRMLLSQGRLVLHGDAYRPTGDLADLAVPETLTALIAARLDELDPADRSLVADAAVLGQTFTIAGLAAVSGLDEPGAEARVRALVRRELFVGQADPRSPERGQYAFVQALIREVAYNTLSRKDRKTRHLAAARFFESRVTEELAGALAGHYLAAHGYATDGPEADALAAQARVALRAAGERAASLGSHAQAIAFFDRALEVSPSPADRLDLHEKALASAREGIDSEPAVRHAEGALTAARELGERERIAFCVAQHLSTVAAFAAGEDTTLEPALAAWEEFSDFRETRAGVNLALAIAAAHGARLHRDEAFEWNDRALAAAERLRLLEETAFAIVRLSFFEFDRRRPRYALILLRGVHDLATANDVLRVHRNTRTQLTFYEQFNDPAAGLAMAREGLEIAARTGSVLYAFLMIGNGVSSAIRLGDWAWASDLLDEWIAKDNGAGQFVELFADRAVVRALRGEDPGADIATAEARVAGVADPQYTGYVGWAKAWRELATGRHAAALVSAIAAADTISYFEPIALPLAGRAALWAGDAAGARLVHGRMVEARWAGRALDIDRATLAAGLAALEGRRAEAVSGYREAIRGWRQLGPAFDEAAAVVDLATLLAPTDREMPEAAGAIAAARETLTRLGAAPFLARLDAGPGGVAGPAGAAARAERSPGVTEPA
jgi:class 3 adenylate cyclase